MKRIIRLSQRLVIGCAFFGLISSAVAGEFTDVIDAFDKDTGDPFDLNISVGYQRSQTQGTITRETTDTDYLHHWDYYGKTKFGKFSHTQDILNLRLDVGLFQDLAFRFVAPIILNDERSLSNPSGTTGWLDGDTRLFSPGFKSPQRSGVDYLAAGLWWGVLNQDRVGEYPHLVVFVEGRFGVGKPLKAACASVTVAADNQCDGTVDGGISQDLNQLRLGLLFSRRYGVLEPFMGIDGMLGWFKGTDPLRDASQGALNTMPPMVGTFDFGMEIIPWEVPAEHRKFVITLGGGAMFVSEGRAYTPLFDALGTSTHFRTTAPVNADGTLNEAARLHWNGMTDIENYGEFFGRLVLTIQPAKYVKFNLGFRMGHQSEHFITKTDQCPAGKVVDGICTEPNLGHRPEIDRPGSRFRVENTLLWSLLLDAVAQF